MEVGNGVKVLLLFYGIYSLDGMDALWYADNVYLVRERIYYNGYWT
jgi:hypothetical protein